MEQKDRITEGKENKSEEREKKSEGSDFLGYDFSGGDHDVCPVFIHDLSPSDTIFQDTHDREVLEEKKKKRERYGGRRAEKVGGTDRERGRRRKGVWKRKREAGSTTHAQSTRNTARVVGWIGRWEALC